MSGISQGKGIDINKVADGTLEAWEDNITITKVTVGGVKEVRITHPEMIAQIGEVKYTILAATVSVNTTDILAFTTYYCYYELINGIMTFVSTTTSPDATATEPEYVWLRQIRFKSVANVATIEFVQRQIMCHDEALHSISDYAYLMPPIYMSGFAPTFDLGTGTLSTEEGKYRRITGNVRTRTAITNGVIYEPAVNLDRANFALIAKYSDDSAIGDNKWVKLLVGILVNAESDYDFIVNIQGKPIAEYASAAEAWADSEHKASTGFSTTRRSAVLPLCWVVMQKATPATITSMDLRETGLVFAAGGTSGVTDHGALNGLTDYIDHPGYLLMDGTRNLTGNLTVDAGITIDGVDLSAHAVDVDAHHAPITLAASAAVLLDLTDQALSFDTQVANTILAGPIFGAAAAVPTFRTLSHTDISDFHTQTALDCPPVTLNTAVDSIFGLSTQQLTLDVQATKTVLAGPISGADAVPTFRTLSYLDISDFVEAAQDAVGAMVANSNSIILEYVDGTPSLKATAKLTEAAFTLANGNNNHNMVITAGDFLVITGPTASFTISGLVAGVSGQKIIIYNPTAERMTIANESSSSIAANRIRTGTGGDIQTASGTGSTGNVTLVYSTIVSRWIVIGWIA